MTSQQPLLGFCLAVCTSVLWGVLPIFLTITLQAMDASTITSIRFLVAGVFVCAVLLLRQKLPNIAILTSQRRWLVVGACVLLVLNYVTNVMGLAHLNPESVQVIMQLAPFLLMVGGVVFFAESFTRMQQAGALSLIIGMLLFFNQRLDILAESTTESPIGIVIIVFAATAWAGYALLQKTLLTTLSAQQLTFLMYTGGFLLLIPMTNFSSLLTLTPLQFWSLVFCCANTIVAYGAFTHAMGIWSAAKVSAVIATAPLFTYASMKLAVAWLPGMFAHSQMDSLAYTGAVMVMLGSALTSLGKSAHIAKA